MIQLNIGGRTDVSRARSNKPAERMDNGQVGRIDGVGTKPTQQRMNAVLEKHIEMCIMKQVDEM